MPRMMRNSQDIGIARRLARIGGDVHGAMALGAWALPFGTRRGELISAFKEIESRDFAFPDSYIVSETLLVSLCPEFFSRRGLVLDVGGLSSAATASRFDANRSVQRALCSGADALFQRFALREGDDQLEVGFALKASELARTHGLPYWIDVLADGLAFGKGNRDGHFTRCIERMVFAGVNVISFPSDLLPVFPEFSPDVSALFFCKVIVVDSFDGFALQSFYDSCLLKKVNIFFDISRLSMPKLLSFLLTVQLLRHGGGLSTVSQPLHR